MLIFSCANEWHVGDKNPPAGYFNDTFLKAAYVLGFLKLVDTNPPVPPELQEYKAIEYKNIDGKSLKLDLYYKKQITGKAPLLIFIHGGGWRKGKREDYLKYLLDFAGRGYVTATISYRLLPQSTFPDAVEDVICAVRWLRKNADSYHIDPDKIAVIGGSAGGYLASMIGYAADVPQFNIGCETGKTSGRVQAVINLYGPTNLTTEYARTHTSTNNFLGMKYADNPALFATASPLSYISADDPPTLIFHGTLDDLVPVSQSDSLHSKLNSFGITSEYHRLEGWPHTMDLAEPINEYCQFTMTQFLEKYIPLNK
ncbi:MAG: alpha/beta hydrolase [Calditrichaeota bacterium]|nr:MAG: alpha/beta hydrolase [Calditrichota bacterium]